MQPSDNSIAFLLFENPLPLAILFVALATGLWILALRQRQRWLIVSGAVSLLLAGGVVLLAYSVVTDRERVESLSEQLVAATSPLDLAQFDAMIDPSASLVGPQGTHWMSYDRMRESLQRLTGSFGVGDQWISQLEVEGAGPGQMISRLLVRTQFEGPRPPTRTLWRLTWQRQPDDSWRVLQIRWLELNNQRPPMHALP